MFEIMHLGRDITFQLGFQFTDNTMSNLFKVAGTQSTQTMREIKFFPSKKKAMVDPKGKNPIYRSHEHQGLAKMHLKYPYCQKRKRR